MTDLGARQLGRQRLAPGLALGRRRADTGLELLKLFAHRRQIGLGGLLEELGLLGRQALGLHAEAMTLVQRQFMREPLDLGLAPHEFALLLNEQATQGVGIQLIEVGGQRHGQIMSDANSPRQSGHPPIARAQSVRITPPSPSRCHGSPSTSASNCARVSATPPWPSVQ